ncbi:amidohydrolase family protein [Actinokineospora globicatena]|uniref:amidohydrolase family protein n=1 Tax=Actinokineospora globicatena TaxID=103729 RepID=UPI0020A4713D|nr:amidohydrolase [Actinokineospora globicatena]MCP2301306.1 Cytosine/adenosine deaminase [Actinokineospora globicatena]GLW77055.1 ethylammeline chlorohydrolase [Actinokineospora globicatena]GLW83889.1 ethylammeline chlorohydrolase [Actinokineospora globicatena]
MRLHAPVILLCDPECTVLRDAVLDIGDDGRITHVGPADHAPAHDGPSRSVTGILMPGLVNAHAHSPMTLLRGLGGDLPLMRWLTEVIWPTEAKLTPDDVYAGMVLGSLEMLRAGVTTSAEMYFYGEEVVRAVLDTGARLVLAPAIIDAPGWDWAAQLADTSRWIDNDGLRFGPGDRIEIGYGPHSAYTLSPEALAQVGAAARERGALVQIHVAESLPEDVAQRAQHGSVPALLDQVGLFGGRVLAAHAVHLSDGDIETLKRHEVGVAHCPGSNTKLASGIARLTDLRAAGVAVGIGTDGPASNDDLDLWEDVRLAGLLARVSTMDSTAVGAADLLLMATRGGAAALSRTDIGTLAVGAWADLVHVGVDDPAFAGGLGIADEHLLSNLVWAAGSRTVKDVWVAGRQVVADTASTTVDAGDALAKARAATGRLI